jgi:hypothetical protein
MYAYCSEDWKAAVTYQGRNAPTFAAFASIIAFLVVFRQNFSIARYNDGRRHLAAMTANFYEGASFAFSFDNGTDQQSFGPHGVWAAQQAMLAGGELDPAAAAFRRDFVHVVSLLHATCLAWLRCDPSLDNFCTHDRAAPPAWDSSYLPGYAPPWYSYFTPFRKVPRRRRHHAASPLSVVGGVSVAERAQLARSPARQQTRFKGVQAGRQAGPLTRARKFLWTSEYAADPAMQGTERRVYQLHGAVLEMLRQRMVGGGMQMAPTIIIRIWNQFATGARARAPRPPRAAAAMPTAHAAAAAAASQDSTTSSSAAT